MDEKREQAKVRDKILKVFKARAKSPGGGPAIIVNEDKHQSKSVYSQIKHDEFSKHKLEDSDDFLLSDDAYASSVNVKERTKQHKMEHQSKEQHTKTTTRKGNEIKTNGHGHAATKKKSHHREKRRKSKSERDNKRAAKQQQVNPHEREEFRKHVKRAREVSHSRQNESHNTSDDQMFVAITQNRLTRQSGIYNQGKKSSRLYRDTLRVSDRVAAAVEEDLKMIVDKPDSPEMHHVSMESLHGETVTPLEESRRTRSSSRSCRSLRSATRKSNSVSGGAKKQLSRNADCPSSDDQAAQALDIQDLSVQLMKSLDLKQLFPGSDYAREIKCELHKLMKSNCSGRDLQINSKSIRKCLHSPKLKTGAESAHQQRFTPHQQMKKRTPASQILSASSRTPASHTVSATRRMATSHTISAARRTPASHTVSAPTIHHATACVQQGSQQSSHCSQDRVLLLETSQDTHGEDAKRIPFSSFEKHCSPAKPSELTFTDNALELLYLAENVQREPLQHIACNQISDSEQIQYDLPHGYPGVVKRTCEDAIQHGQVRVAKPMELKSYQGPDDIWHSDHFRESRMLERGIYDRYSDENAATYHTQLHHEHSSTDILDFIGMGMDPMEVTGPSPSMPEVPHHSYNRPSPVQSRQESHHPHTISKFQRSDSDSDSSSPVWRPAFNISPIKKPQLNSPGPPKFYPQKMF